MTMVRGIQAWEVDAVWPKVGPLIETALQHADGDYALEDVRESLREGSQPHRQLFVAWPEMHSVGLTMIEHRPQKDVLVLFAYAGNLFPLWRGVLERLEEWARDQGCAAIEIEGRLGWAKLLPDYRARAKLRKELA